LARRQDGKTARRQDGKTARRQDGKTARRQDGKTARRQDGKTARWIKRLMIDDYRLRNNNKSTINNPPCPLAI
jgi:hypothetical protein